MNHKAIRILGVSLFLFAFSTGAVAQDLEMGYFLGGNPYAFRQNPAFQSERGLASIALGQTGFGAWSNLGISSLLYPDSNGKVYTFLNDRVSSAEFLKNIHQRNHIDADVLVNILTVGFWTHEDTFLTMDVNVRSLNALSAPYDLFRFLKDGSSSSSFFDLSGLGYRSQAFAEAAFGWSRIFGDITVGARLKVLVGGLAAEARMKKLQMTMNGERWEVQTEGEVIGSSPSFRMDKDANGNYDFETLEFSDSEYGVAGYGGAVDLGFSWNVLPLLTVSGALLDLGTIRWNHEIYGTTLEGTFAWDPSKKQPIDPSSDDPMGAEIDEALNSLSGLFQFKDSGSGKPGFEALPFRVNLGAEFRMPFYDRLSVGALYSGRGVNTFARHTGRLSLNWNPLDFLSMSLGTTLNKVGQSLGFALNLHPVGINLTIGGDYIPFRTVNISPLIKDIPAKYKSYTLIPAGRMNMNLYVGLNIAFGRRHLDYARRSIQ